MSSNRESNFVGKLSPLIFCEENEIVSRVEAKGGEDLRAAKRGFRAEALAKGKDKLLLLYEEEALALIAILLLFILLVKLLIVLFMIKISNKC